MRAILIATTMLFSSAAMAQDMGAQTPPANQPMQSDTAPATPDAGMTPPADGSTTPPPAGGDMAPPATDSMSQPGATPPAANAPMGSQPSAGQPASDPSSYPPCSRTVKDRCTNRGGR